MNARGGSAVAYTEQRVTSIANAIPLTTDKSVIEANALMATALASQIKLVGELIRTYDERIVIRYASRCRAVQITTGHRAVYGPTYACRTG